MALVWSIPVWVWPLLLVLAAGAVVWTRWAYLATRPTPGAGLRRILFALRTTVLLLLILAVAGPLLSRTWQRAVSGEVVLLFEDSASMVLADGWEADTDTTSAGGGRWQRALSLAAELDSVLASREPTPVPTFLRGNGRDPLREFSPDDPVVPLPAAYGTDLRRLQSMVADRLAGRPLAGIVLFSDGGETDAVNDGPPQRTSAARRSTAPLIAVGLGDPEGPADRILADVRYPGTAFENDEVVVEVSVAHRYGYGDSVPPIRAVLRDDGEAVAETTVVAGPELTNLELVFRPREAGSRLYELEVSPLDNERYRGNNRMSLAIDVRQDRARVLLLAAAADWDVRFLAQAAARESRLDLSVVHGAESGLVFADSLVPFSAPRSAEDWLVWDGVILAGWTGEIGRFEWARLAEAVERGLGLLVLPDKSSPHRLGVLDPPPAGLAELLPARFEVWRWQAGPFRIRSAGKGVGHAILAGVGSDAPDGVDRRTTGLADLPPLRALLPCQPIPGATTLLVGEMRHQQQIVPPFPLLVTADREAGRVGWFGGDRLWEMAFWMPAGGLEAGDGPRESPVGGLLRNLLVWTTEGEPARELVFSGGRRTFQEGEPVRLVSLWRDQRGDPVTGRHRELLLRQGREGTPEFLERSFPLTESASRPGYAAVQLPPLPPGAYSVRLVGAGQPPVTSDELGIMVVPYSIESTQVRQDVRRLRQLAAGPADAYVDGNEPTAMSQIVATLDAWNWAGRTVRARFRLDPFAGWPFLIVVAVLLGWEWFLRRRNGLL